MTSASDDLDNYQIQLQQVEAALVAEPNNEELLKLKTDLNEIIKLQQELVSKEEPSGTSEPTDFADKINWKIGDRCLAPTKSGRMHVAVIDGLSQDKAAITFTGNGIKHMLRVSELRLAPAEEKKNYLFPPNKSSSAPKKEWQLERERRKMRAQKKEQRRKQIDEVKEQEKSKWQQFNAKASAKHLKGLKRLEATSSASDGPKNGISRQTVVSSRKDQSFGANQRGYEIMDSLF